MHGSRTVIHSLPAWAQALSLCLPICLRMCSSPSKPSGISVYVWWYSWWRRSGCFGGLVANFEVLHFRCQLWTVAKQHPRACQNTQGGLAGQMSVSSTCTCLALCLPCLPCETPHINCCAAVPDHESLTSLQNSNCMRSAGVCN